MDEILRIFADKNVRTHFEMKKVIVNWCWLDLNTYLHILTMVVNCWLLHSTIQNSVCMSYTTVIQVNYNRITVILYSWRCKNMHIGIAFQKCVGDPVWMKPGDLVSLQNCAHTQLSTLVRSTSIGIASLIVVQGP